MSFGRGAASAGLATAAAVASFLWWHTAPAHPPVEAIPAASAEAIEPAATAAGPTAAQLVTDIEAAQHAVIAQLGHPPYSGPIDARPDFVSGFEWQVLEGVARTHADPPGELTRLVNRLRFTRLQSLWQSLRDAGNRSGLRGQLAQQLLDEIPGRVSAHQLDLAQAQGLQWQLIEDLVSDPMERLQRASRESLRLGRPAASS